MATATLRALAAEWGKPGAYEMDSLTKSSGFLRVAEAIPASHGATHKYKKLDALPTFSIVDPGGSSGDTTLNSNVFSTDLKIARANQSEPSDIVDDWPSGKAGYFNGQRPAYLEAYGQKLSSVIYYGDNSTHGDVSFGPGLHQLAKAYGNEIDAGGDSGATTTIFAVKFRPGSNGCGLLYDSNITGAGQIMKSDVLNGGQKVLETTNTTGNLKKLVYQVSHYGKAAFLSTSSYDVARLHSISYTADDTPTADEMQQLIDMVRGEAGNTFLFMNRLGRRSINKLKLDDLFTRVQDTEYNTIIETFAGIPIVLDENIISTETDALD